MSEIDEDTLRMLNNIGAKPEEWFGRCCGCEKLITGVVVKRDGDVTMCADCSILSQRNDDREWVDESKQDSIVFSLPDEDDEEEVLTEYEQMIEKILDAKAERTGMLNAGWKQTQSGEFYYVDDDNPNILHLSY